jgi:uncharacterized protein (TIGR03435 family)
VQRAKVLSVYLATTLGLSGQIATSAFDAASLKVFEGRHYPGSLQLKGGPGTSDPGRVTWGVVDLRSLLMKAFDVEDYRVAGLPSPVGRDITWFTLTATMPAETTKQQFQLMLQNLLIERFQIRLHHETRVYPGYELVVASGGPKLKLPADPDAAEPLFGANGEMDKEGFLVLPPGHGDGIVTGEGTRAKFQNWTIGEFIYPFLVGWIRQAAGLQGAAHIVDKTGLTGRYDFTIRFDSRAGGRAAVIGPQVGEGRSVETDDGSGLPDLFKALEKQLGLRLVKVKGIPLDAIVIDRAEKVPLEN